MADTESPTPQAAAEPQLKAPKDKNCPFCGQAFTSSSLGRHLDLYIRHKNPKAADGIHVVEEIRKLRGGITRRQFKGNIGTPRRSESGSRTPANKRYGVESEDSSMIVDSPEADDDDLDVPKSRSQFKDRDGGSRRPSRLGTKTPDLRRDTSRQMQKADLDQRHRTSEEAELASATEMALRELLKSVREASEKASGCNLFDFDPYTLSFPSLCLHILPAPPTLFSPTPFPTSESWSTSPPGQAQFDAVNRHVQKRLRAYHQQRQINQAYPSAAQSNASSAANSPLPTPPLLDSESQKLYRHIADSYKHWTRHSEKTRQEHWQIEILRCFARADERRREVETRLESAQKEIEYLKASRWARAPDVSPFSIHLGRETARELGKQGMDYRNWDYDRLIEKCRSSIRDGRASVSGMAAQKPLPADSAKSRNGSMAGLQISQFSAITQPRQGSPIKTEGAMPFTAPPTVNGDTCSDHLDAEGDDDDDGDVDLTPHTVSDEDMSHGQIQRPQPAHQQQRHHGLPHQPTPIHPPQQQQLQPRIQPALHVTQAQAQHLQHVQAHVQAQQAQIQAQAQWVTHHMSQSQNQDFRPHQHQHQHQQLSPHILNSAANSRRPSLAMLDSLALTTTNVNGLSVPMGMSTGMEGMDNHPDMFRMDMALGATYVGSNDVGVSLGS